MQPPVAFVGEYLLGARRAAALRCLLDESDRTWTAADLQRASGLSYSSALVELRTLAGLGLLDYVRVNAARGEYRVNSRLPVLAALEVLVRG